ncbi:MAG: hypothetical protein JSW56_17390, partial [Deltaproteobacteria bacterium]
TVSQPYDAYIPQADAVFLVKEKSKKEAISYMSKFWKDLLTVKGKDVSLNNLSGLASGVLKIIKIDETVFADQNKRQFFIKATVEIDNNTLYNRAMELVRNQFLLERYEESWQDFTELLRKLEKQHLDLLTSLHYERKTYNSIVRKRFRKMIDKLRANQFYTAALDVWPVDRKDDYWFGLSTAKNYVDQAIELDPECARCFFLRGEIYFKDLFFNAADEDYSRAITLDPDYAAPDDKEDT